MRRMKAILALALSAVSLVACSSGGGGSPPTTIVTGTIAFFIVRASNNRDSVSILPGNTVQLGGVTYDESLNPLALVGDTAWVSRNPSIASVDSHGVVTTIVIGSTWVVGSFKPANSQTSYADSVFITSVGQN
jgi:hypothetical protein